MVQDRLHRKTEVTRQRYNRIVGAYDRMEADVERRAFQKWRQQLWSQVHGKHILEMGVGTGKNIPYYPPDSQVVAIDLSERMLDYAWEFALEQGVKVDLQVMDVQHLTFPDASFDSVVATFVYCSVPDPVLGLCEIERATKPGGDIWLLEHMRVDKPVVGVAMDVLNPVVVRMMGANINRTTVDNVHLAGLRVVQITRLMGDLVRLIHARPS